MGDEWERRFSSYALLRFVDDEEQRNDPDVEEKRGNEAWTRVCDR